MEACPRAARCVCKDTMGDEGEGEGENGMSWKPACLKCFLKLRKPRSLSYWGLWNPTWAENFFFNSAFLFCYTSIDLPWIWTDIFLLILLNQPVSKYIIEGVAYVCKIHNWTDWEKEVKGSFALGLHQLLQLNLDCSFTRSTELTSLKIWKHWMGRWHQFFLQSLQLKRTFCFQGTADMADESGVEQRRLHWPLGNTEWPGSSPKIDIIAIYNGKAWKV